MQSLDAVGLVALVCVFSAMVALGIGVEPARVLARGFPLRSLLAALVIALVLAPIAAILFSHAFGLRSSELVGLILMGISPGAPMALRKSGQSGADRDFALVLQVAVAILAIGAVPIWIFILHRIYGRDADISVLVLAKQVFLAQILPLSCGIALRRTLPAKARKLARPLLMFSGVLMAIVAVLLVALFWRPLADLSAGAWGASAALTVTAILLATVACGPSPSTRMAAAVICSLRNPGIALLIISASDLPAESRIVVIGHVLVTAILLGASLALLKRSKAYERERALS